MATRSNTSPTCAAKAALPRPSFTFKKASVFHWWGGVKPTGNYGADCETGKALAAEWLATTGTAGGMQSLVWIILDMPRDREATGLEVGFLGHLARAAALGNLMLDQQAGQAFLDAFATERKAA